ncbi:hypothetical protein EAE96_003376 [Botrytis aclada]|nr:hypothetical protein EAE96_003376 [Botrytis aclada]
MSENKNSSQNDKLIFQGQIPPCAGMTASEFVDMDDGKLLEHYLRTNNSTALQKIRPRLSSEGKVTTAMMVADLSSSIDFLKAPRENPSICTSCSSYLPLLYFRLSCKGDFCAKCLRALIHRESLTTAGGYWYSLRHGTHGPEIVMKSDLDDRYRAQQSSNWHS